MSAGKIKIVATLGPALEGAERLQAAIEAGVDVFRMNYSHGEAAAKEKSAELIRSIAKKMGKTVGILADLQGPKIRISKFAKGGENLKAGQRFDLVAGLDKGSASEVGLEWLPLIADAKTGDVLVLDDGKMRMKVTGKEPSRLICEVLTDGRLSDRKGVNKLGGGLSAGALTDKDREDIASAARMQADFLAVSFVKNKSDMEEAKGLFRAYGGDGLMVAKIERAEAIENLDEIIMISDGIMVARGDLALDVGDAAVPFLQKDMIARAKKNLRFSITATQMLESMIESVAPTRAEVSDIANATLDGSDALMLSAESASGKHPIAAIKTMRWIADEACSHQKPDVSLDVLFAQSHAREGQACALAAVAGAKLAGAGLMVALTSSGMSALWISRALGGLPIAGVSPSERACAKMAMFRGVTPILAPIQSGALFHEVWPGLKAELLRCGAAKAGQKAVITYGEPMGSVGSSNMMRIEEL